MSKQRLTEIAVSLHHLSLSLNDGLLGDYADELAAMAESMPVEPNKSDKCAACGLMRRTHPVECCPDGFTA